MGQRHREDSLARHLGAVGDRGYDVRMGQLGIVRQQFSLGHAIGEEVEDQRDPEAGAFDARLSAADFRIDGYAI